MEFSKEDLELLEKCIKSPDRYEISVDNDCVSVWDKETEESESFKEFGYYFIVQILRYLGCNADFC